MHRGAAILIGLTACSFKLTAAPAGGVDAPIDSVDAYVVDVSTAICLAWDPHHFDPCTIPGPAAALDLSQAGTYMLDTQAGTLVPPVGSGIPLSSTTLAQSGGDPAFLISVESLTVGTAATLRVIGDKPLIVASWGAISVAGVIDVGSHIATIDQLTPIPATLITTISAGAGANPSACSAVAAMAGGPGNSGTGGGGGGGFAGTGGRGGNGDTGGVNPGGAGGSTAFAPAVVRGGCTGAVSGPPIAGGGLVDPSTTTTTSPGGPGGGAIQLTAREGVSITGTITAGGAGGGPAQHGSANGGGGAGSGGYIGIEGSTVLITAATLAANGGGGGSSGRFAARGFDGEDGHASTVAAIGGAGDGCSLQAPSGSAGATLAGGGVDPLTIASCGGGGGGGGAGYILTWGVVSITNSTTSPDAQLGPL